MSIHQHGERNRKRPPATSAATAAVGNRDWTREHDTKAFCTHCRNWRSSKHVDQHAIIIAGGERTRDYRP